MFTVLLKNVDQLQIGLIAQALAGYKKVPVLDATFEAKRSWGIIGEKLEQEPAEALRAALEKQKLESLVVPHEKLRALPAFEAIARDNFPWQTMPWDRIRVLGVAVIKSTSSHTVEEKQGPSTAQKAASIGIMMATGIPISIGPKKETIKKTVTDTELSFVLDIVSDGPAQRYRVNGENFNYTFLKENMLPSAMGNFRLLLKELKARAPQAINNRGMKIFLAGQPVNTMGYESLADLEKECRWLFSL